MTFTPSRYIVKTLYNEEVKVQPITSKACSIIIKKTECHMYQTKQAKPFYVVLMNVHPSIKEVEIKNSIHKWNIKQRKTNIPLHMFFIDLKLSENNKEIYTTSQRFSPFLYIAWRFFVVI